MWTIYWITRLDTIILISCVISLLFIVIVGVFSVWYFTDYDKDCEEDVRARKFYFMSIAIMILNILIWIFTPTKEDALLMYTGEYIENNEEIQNIPDKAVKCFDKLMDDYLDNNKEK